MVSRPYLITQYASNEHELYDVLKFFDRLLNFFNSGTELLGNLLREFFLCEPFIKLDFIVLSKFRISLNVRDILDQKPKVFPRQN